MKFQHKWKATSDVKGNHDTLNCHVDYKCIKCGKEMIDYYHKLPRDESSCIK